MRAVDCPCGEHLEAQTDTALLEAAKQHNTEEHPDQYSEIDLRTLVNTAAYDARMAAE